MARTASYYINWGLMSIAVKKIPAARNNKIDLTILHKDCFEAGQPANRRQQFPCVTCNTPVSEQDGNMIRAFQVDKKLNRYVILEPAELESLGSENNKLMEIQAFVPSDDVDPIYFGPADYLEPIDPPGAKVYGLLLDVLVNTKRGAVVQYVARDRDHIGYIRAFQNTVLMLHDLFFLPEVKPVPTFVAPTVSEAERAMAQQLCEIAAGPFNLDPYADQYQTRLSDLITAKLEGKTVTLAPAAAPASPSTNLLDAMKASLAAAEAKKAGSTARKEPAAAPARTEEPVAPKKAARARKAS